MPAATATALPPDEPPGTLVTSQGFLTGKNALFSEEEPMAISSILHLPGRTAFRRPKACHHRRVVGRSIAAIRIQVGLARVLQLG